MKKAVIILTALVAALASACSPSEVSEEKKPIVLTILAGQSTSDAGTEDMIDEWMQQRYPDVKLEWECVDWGDRFNTQMRGRFAAGDVPDIMIGKAQDVHTYAAVGQLGEINIDAGSSIAQSALDTVTIDGKIYGVPYNAWYQEVLYNKEIFEETGIEPPRTLEEMEEVILCLESKGVVPFATHFQESWNVGNMTMQYMINDIFRYDSEWGEKFREGTVSYSDNGAILRCMLNNKMILDASWEDALQLDQFECDSRFTQGEAAMYLTGSWSLQFANQYGKDIEFGIFPFPNQNGDAALIRETNITFMKSAFTEHDELIDDIFNSLLKDKKLLQEVLDFTQSSSVITGADTVGSSWIQDDISRYEAEGKIIDASVGNVQLVWEFQNSVAQEQLSWLKNEKSLREVLSYADENRENSVYE